MENIDEKEFVPLQYGIPPEALGKFKINRLGEVLRIEDNRIIRPIKFLHAHGDGYPRTVLPLGNRKQKSCLIHRLVALHFIKNDDPIHKTQVDHKDRNPQNYHYLNLSWVSQTENLKNRGKIVRKPKWYLRKLDDQGNVVEEHTDTDFDKNTVNEIFQAHKKGQTYDGNLWAISNLVLENFIKKYGKPKEWRRVQRFPDFELYCSDNGLIRTKRGSKWYITPGHPNKANYMVFNYQNRTYRIHRLIYETFVNGGKELQPGLEVDHIDSDSYNNCYQNLRAVTHKENMNNPITIERNSRKVKMFSMADEFEQEFTSIVQANLFLGLASNNSRIVVVCKHKKATSIGYGGHLWCYDGDEESIKEGVKSLIFQYDKDKNLIGIYEPYHLSSKLRKMGENVSYYQYKMALNTGKICSAGYYFSKGPKTFD